MIQRLPAILCLAALASGCAAPRPPEAPKDEPPRPLWELAPEGASAGMVIHDGTLARAFALYASLRTRDAGTEPDAAANVAAAWERMGIDVAKGAAVFAWPQRERGVLMVLPTKDAALPAQTAGAGRVVREIGGGYRCVRAAGRLVCAQSLADVDAAAAPHTSGLARLVARLPAEDRGDIELFASPRAAEVAHLRERARPLGLLTGVATAFRFRPDGASVHVHLLGNADTPTARGFAGAPPPPGLSPTAAGAASAVRAHFDPLALGVANSSMDPRLRSELVEQLAGDIEATTSGAGVAGAAIVAPLRDPARVERYVKERCADTGGTVRRSALDRIRVTEHGCAMRFDPTLLLLPVDMRPVPIAIDVLDRRLVVRIGEAHEPTAAERAAEALVEGEEARRALAGPSALVMYSRRPMIGPEVGAGKALKEMIPLVDARGVAMMDAWSDIGAHIYQALLTARITEDGLILHGDFTSFAPDPKDARDAYEAALAKRAKGDEPGYRAALAEIEARFPGTRAARRAAEVKNATPWVGAGVMFLGVLGGIFSRK